MDKKVQDILSKMTLEDKISLCNGADFWHSKAMAQYGIPAVTMSDGPHGVRCQKNSADMLGVNESEPATCFPTAVTSGATWDAELLKAEGQAIGEEGLSYGVDVVLGPGVNIKRNPLCGRNFEYFSEDPCIAGAMGAAWVQGAQSTGAGTSLKHFTANNQEYKRFNGNSQVDERTLRELYLPAFETVIKTAQPETVMCSYPRINNVHASDNHWLLTDVLRKDWGFAGLVVTDWGALCDRVKAMHAGCDLSMPGGSTYMEDWVAAANPNPVVVLFCGCAVEMPWLDKVKAVLYMGLPGQAGGAAAANLLTGKANPSGKLTETWPLCYDDVPSRDTFGKKTTHYKEGLYAGYRYYDKAGKAVRFPFGYGLSYTQFAYSDLKIEGRTVTAAVTNTGSTAGAEVVQLYVAPPKNGLYRPAKELKGFAKVSLQPGESQTVRFELNDRSFAVWCDGWQIPAGSYEICVGASVADIRLHAALTVDGVSLAAPDWQKGSWYETLQGLPTDAEFEKLCGSPLQSDPEPKKGAFTMEHSTMELKDISAVMMQMFKGTEATIAKSFGGKADYSDPTFKMMVMSGADAPLRAAVLSSCGMFPANLAEGMLALANGHPLNGVKKLIKK